MTINIQLFSVAIISFLLSSFGYAADLLSKKYISEVGVSLSFPKEYALKKSNELNRRGTFVSYDFGSRNDGFPNLSEIQFFSIKSIKHFEKACSMETGGGGDGFCETRDYPTAEVYTDQKLALQNPKGLKTKYQIKRIGIRNYIVSQDSSGDGITREYRFFLNDTMVAIWINMSESSQLKKADKLLSQLIIE
jgi:hypothetical protein